MLSGWVAFSYGKPSYLMALCYNFEILVFYQAYSATLELSDIPKNSHGETQTKTMLHSFPIFFSPPSTQRGKIK